MASKGVETRSRVRAVVNIAGLAARRTLGQVTGFNRTTLAVGVVAVAIALLLVVTSVSIGLATQTTVRSEDIDYWVVPEAASTQSTVVSVSGPQLGAVHDGNDAITNIAGVIYSTPVLIELVRLRAPNSRQPEYVLGIGIVPARSTTSVGGIPTRGMRPGDPHYANGAYSGPVTGEVVLSPAAAELLNASTGAELAVGSPSTGQVDYSSFGVISVSGTGPRVVQGEVPVAVFHLSELQSLTGAASGDQADQILVQSDEPNLGPELERVYPDAAVVTRSGLTTKQVLDADVPLAVSVTAFVVGLAIATLFVATTMGLVVEAERRELAVLASVGFTPGARFLFVVTTTMTLAFLGGIGGIVVGTAGVFVLNIAVGTFTSVNVVGVLTPRLLLYGLGVSVLTGLLSSPYPVLLARRTDISAELGR